MNHEGETILMIHNLIVVHRIPVNGPKEVNLNILGLEIEWNQQWSFGLEIEWNRPWKFLEFCVPLSPDSRSKSHKAAGVDA